MAITTRRVNKDEGNGKGGISDCEGNKESNCKEEGSGKQQQQLDNINRDNDNNHNNNSNKNYNNYDNDADYDNKDNNNNNRVAAGGGWWQWGRGTKEAAVGLIETEFWVLLLVSKGKGQGRQTGSLKYPSEQFMYIGIWY